MLLETVEYVLTFAFGAGFFRWLGVVILIGVIGSCIPFAGFKINIDKK